MTLFTVSIRLRKSPIEAARAEQDRERRVLLAVGRVDRAEPRSRAGAARRSGCASRSESAACSARVSRSIAASSSVAPLYASIAFSSWTSSEWISFRTRCASARLAAICGWLGRRGTGQRGATPEATMQYEGRLPSAGARGDTPHHSRQAHREGPVRHEVHDPSSGRGHGQPRRSSNTRAKMWTKRDHFGPSRTRRRCGTVGRPCVARSHRLARLLARDRGIPAPPRRPARPARHRARASASCSSKQRRAGRAVARGGRRALRAREPAPAGTRRSRAASTRARRRSRAQRRPRCGTAVPGRAADDGGRAAAARRAAPAPLRAG